MGLRQETREECRASISGDRGSSREGKKGKTIKSLKDRKERSDELWEVSGGRHLDEAQASGPGNRADVGLCLHWRPGRKRHRKNVVEVRVKSCGTSRGRHLRTARCLGLEYGEMVAGD